MLTTASAEKVSESERQLLVEESTYLTIDNITNNVYTYILTYLCIILSI